jgi:hypothetical protein
MKNWTPDASQHFESWLGRVKRSVAGDPGINPDDVAQDLRAHVHAELETMPEPVTVGTLDQVLQGLGNPAQWTESPAAPGLRAKLHDDVGAVIADCQKALAGDWGLPVLIALLTLFSLPVIDDGGAFVLGLMYFIARAQIVHAPNRLAGNQKYLVYFPLAIGAGLLAGVVLAFPLLMSIGTFRGPRTLGYWTSQYQLLWSMGAWWVILGFVARREVKRVQQALRPFAGWFEATHATFLMFLGGAFLILSTVMLMS